MTIQNRPIDLQAVSVVPNVDDAGDDYEHWVIKRSFAMIWPIGLMGLIVDIAHLLLVDPAFYLKGFWEKNVHYFHLAIWHVVVAIFFGSLLIGYKRSQTHLDRTVLLITWFVGANGIFAWFCYISWFLIGDMSIFTVALVGIAAVFTFPGQLRRILAIASAMSVGVAISVLDERDTFISSGIYVNLIAVVTISFLIDGFMTQTSKALFHEKCRADAERSRADAVLYNALPVSIANELKLHKTVKAEKFQRMTVLFADIVGFTKFSSSLPPDAVILVLNQIFTEFDNLVDSYEVEKIKTIGDAYMVVGKGNADRVADLAIEMINKVAAYNQLNGVNLELRFGMHVGPTVAGVIGLKRFLYDVWGDAVNTASRLETMGLPGKIHVSEAIAQELKDKFALEDRGETDIKGKGIMRTYFLGQRLPS